MLVNPFEMLKSNTEGRSKILNTISFEQSVQVSESARCIATALRFGQIIYWCANSGSAAECSHVVAELLGQFKNGRRSLPSLALNSDSSAITCIAIDFGSDQIFFGQLEGLGKPCDVLVVLSTSGMSKNINSVLKQANLMGLKSIALLGKGSGGAFGLADYSIIIDSDETARIYEMYLLLGHTFCEYAELDLDLAQ